MSLSIPPDTTGGTQFQTLTKNLFGLNITGSASDITKANKLWSEFLTSQNLATEVAFETALKTNPDGTISSTNLPAQIKKYTGLYNDFVYDQLTATFQSDLKILQTVNTQEERDVIFKTLTLVLHMLSVLQTTMRTSSEALLFYTKLQQQYTEMLKKVPLLVVDSITVTTINKEDVGKTVLMGFGNITIRDVYNYLLKQRELHPQGTYSDNGKPAWKYEKPYIAGGCFFNLTDTLGNLHIVCRQSDATSAPTLFDVTVQNSSSVLDDLMKAATASPLVQNADRSSFLSLSVATYTPIFMSSSVNEDPAKKSEEDKQRQATRAEFNGQLQLYISNAQANRDLAQSRSKPIENVVNQTREAIQAQLTLINSMIDLLKGLIGAIART